MDAVTVFKKQHADIHQHHTRYHSHRRYYKTLLSTF